MTKNKIGFLIIASAIIWAAIIISCALILKDTPYKGKINYILICGLITHLLFVWTPLGNQYRNKEK